jgi:hypothetical protein
MEFTFETRRHGRCVAEAEQRHDHIEIEITFDRYSDPKCIHYQLQVRDLPLPKQIPDGGALQDATRIAINHFQTMASKDGEVFKFQCSRITARWSGPLFNKLNKSK